MIDYWNGGGQTVFAYRLLVVRYGCSQSWRDGCMRNCRGGSGSSRITAAALTSTALESLKVLVEDRMLGQQASDNIRRLLRLELL